MCDSPILRDICRSLYDASEFYRRWTYSVPGAVRDIPGEHRALMEAALARDTERAVALLTEHFERTTRTVLASLPSMSPMGAARKLVPLGAARRRGSPAS
jgi:DNA-binding GntR family transcriptional regulator